MTLLEILEAIKATGGVGASRLVNEMIFYWRFAEAKTKNETNALAYELEFDAWLKNREQRIGNGLPLKPAPTPLPLMKVAQDHDTGLPLESTGPELCAVPNPEPLLPTVLDPNAIISRVGARHPGTDIWAMLAGDNAPNGYRTTHEGFQLYKKLSFMPPNGVYKLVKS